MRAVLKVVGGKSDGREIAITVPEFVIGRGDKAHLRPSSELISRMHCAIRLKEGKVEIEDLGSRNGSFVNDEALTEPHIAKSGDRLRVGRLSFEVLIDPITAGNKKPKVKDVAEAAARTVEKRKPKDGEQFEDSITDWLSEPDNSPLNDSFNSSETVQFSMEEIDALLSGDSNEKPTELDGSPNADVSEDEEEDEDDDEEGAKKKKKKKEFGKLPPQPKFSHDDSTSAAGDVLKKFFNRR